MCTVRREETLTTMHSAAKILSSEETTHIKRHGMISNSRPYKEIHNLKIKLLNI